MQATATRGFSLPVLAIAAVVITVCGAILFLSTRDSNVTQWHVPYQVVRGAVSYPLYDKHHCYSPSEVAPIRRIGEASGLPLYAPPGSDPDTFYVQPNDHACFMRYLSLSNVG